MTDAALQLHPDRLLPAEPTTRGIARRLYAAVRDLPIISPHGHVPPEWIAEDVPFGDPTSLLISPDHYVTRLLHAHGVPLETPRRRRHGTGRRAAGGLAGAVHPLGRLPRDAEPVLAGERARRHLRGDRAAVRGHRRRDLRPGRRDAAPTRLPAAGAAASASASRCWPPPTTRADDLAHHAAIRDDAAIRTRVLPTFRPDRYLEPGRADWPELVDALGAAADTDTSRLQGLHRGAGGPAAALHRARRRLRRPQPRRRRHRPRSTRPTPSGSSRRPGRARRPRTRRRRCAATCCWRWRGCRWRTGW